MRPSPVGVVQEARFGKPARLLLSALLVGAMAATSSCGDRTTTGPALQASASTVADGPASRNAQHSVRWGTGLLRCPQVPHVSESLTVGRRGGKLDVGPVVLAVPPGALADTVTITLEVLSDTVRAARLRPEGLVFQKPVYLVMSYANCQTYGSKKAKRIAYTSDEWVVLEYVQSRDHHKSKKVVGQLDHFSNYALSW